MKSLDQKTLKELLDYDPSTGIFIWRLSLNPRGKMGAQAGCRSRAYRVIRIYDVLYAAHQLAWLYVHGEWPQQGIDHINGIGSDNRIANLRLADCSQNGFNCKRRKAFGYKGVFPKKGKWRASIGHRGRQFHLGTFATPEEAQSAYMEAARRLGGEFTSPG